MAKKDEYKVTATEKFAEKTNSWIGNHAKLLIGIGAGVIVVLIALLIVFSVMNNSKEKKFEALSALDSSYTQIAELGEEQFISDAEALIEDAGLDSYPGAKAALYLGDIYYSNEDYAKALDLYTQIAEAQSGSYLYQVATINAAASNEMLGNTAEALNLYNLLWDSFGKEGIYGSKALFNAARLYEAEGNIDLAKATYEQLAGEYSTTQSEYAALATTRLAQLN